MNLDQCSVEELQQYILDAKKQLNGDLLIPAHHYISSDVVKVADLLGDSYKLAVDVSRTNAKWIVFAGVSFMAEGGAILAKEGQTVLSPDFTAGCPMADMITVEKANTAYDLMIKMQGKKPAPVIYMNSYADTKAWTGERGGSVCTSSNAHLIIKHYLDQNQTIFFFPDQHLGRNIAASMNIPDIELALIKQNFNVVLANGTVLTKDQINSDQLTAEEKAILAKIKIFFWDGCCPLHQTFTTADVEKMRFKFSDAHFIVHPEVNHSVCEKSDSFGSTQKIYNRIKSEDDKTCWVVGTELNFIYRIASEFPEKTVVPLNPIGCKTMAKITLLKCAKTIEMLMNHLEKGTPLSQVVTVDPKVRKNAAIALQTMIHIVEG